MTGKNKTLVYNGLPIAEINVNGEAFFAGNHALALEKSARRFGKQDKSV